MLNHLKRLLPSPEQAICTMQGGYRMALKPSADSFERHLYRSRTYEAATLDIMDRILKPGDVMVDVGANLGLMTLHASRLVGPDGLVIALEPHPQMHKRLLENISLNGFTNVRPIELAAGAAQGSATLYDVPSVNIGRSSLIQPSIAHIAGAPVEVRPLDDILVEFRPPKFVKIDVEGFEANVLCGAARVLSQRPVICMEVSCALDHVGDPLAAHDIVMASGAYRAYRFKRGKERPSPLVEIAARSALQGAKHENIIYMPDWAPAVGHGETPRA